VKKAVCLKDGGHWAAKLVDKAKLEHEDALALESEVTILQRVCDHIGERSLRLLSCHTDTSHACLL
jgi:hypothetical protein